MDASSIFNELLHKIENSKLNYIISKTPFSAKISIKKSFIKTFDAPSQNQAEAKVKQDHLEAKKLVTVQEQNIRLDEMLKEERLKVKYLEAQIGDLREDLLKVNLVFISWQLCLILRNSLKVQNSF